jgi:hypothetical protein
VSESVSANANERGANECREEERGLSRAGGPGPGPGSGPERVKTQSRKAQHCWPVVVGQPWCHCGGGSSAGSAVEYGTQGYVTFRRSH